VKCVVAAVGVHVEPLGGADVEVERTGRRRARAVELHTARSRGGLDGELLAAVATVDLDRVRAGAALVDVVVVVVQTIVSSRSLPVIVSLRSPASTVVEATFPNCAVVTPARLIAFTPCPPLTTIDVSASQFVAGAGLAPLTFT